MSLGWRGSGHERPEASGFRPAQGLRRPAVAFIEKGLVRWQRCSCDTFIMPAIGSLGLGNKLLKLMIHGTKSHFEECIFLCIQTMYMQSV